MNYFHFGMRSIHLRRIGFGMFQAAALALILTIAMPDRAADESAVKSRV